MRASNARTLGPAVMRAIGRKLRAMYAHIIADGVPEHFAAILCRLDKPTGPRNDVPNIGYGRVCLYPVPEAEHLQSVRRTACVAETPIIAPLVICQFFPGDDVVGCRPVRYVVVGAIDYSSSYVILYVL
jgi:Anti-sigma factor NepR